MDLPLEPPLEPMLAKASAGLPEGDGWLYEPKWDGFRAIVFRDRDEVYIQSRDKKPLDRYFPELAEPLRVNLPERCVVDGEVVIANDGTLDFEALLLRIHPAASRVSMLAEQSPASFVAWDLLALDDEALLAMPQAERRARLEAALARVRRPGRLRATPGSPARTTSPAIAGRERRVRPATARRSCGPSDRAPVRERQPAHCRRLSCRRSPEGPRCRSRSSTEDTSRSHG
jgi:ATP-dependent DNA ligase